MARHRHRDASAPASAVADAPWRGVFYPKGLKQADELAYAASHLTTIEIIMPRITAPAMSASMGRRGA